MANPSGLTSLFRRDMPEALLQTFLDAGYPPIGETLIEALPFVGYDPETYRLQGAPATGLLNHGDTVDLGNHVYEVLHLPGHSPGGIGLFEHETGILFGADAIYDGPLIYEGPGDERRRLPQNVRPFEISSGHDGPWRARPQL